MQTFHPYVSHKKAAMALDYRRLGKQRVECKQILMALLGETKAWANHPVTKRWAGYERELCRYAIAICEVWISKGYKDSLLPYFQCMLEYLSRYQRFGDKFPPWLTFGFSQNHKALLYKKDPEYYKDWYAVQ
jgi:hypothetical protein